MRAGRENLFAFRTDALKDAHTYLDQVSAQWDDARARLKNFVEY